MKGSRMDFKKDTEDIQFLLQGRLDNCSRQRLRAVEISLNRYSNSDHRMSSKEVQLALQENDIHLPKRTIKELCDFYSDNRGVNYQAVHQCLQVAHSRTGRDSIVAMNRKPTRRPRPKEEQMEDLIQRLRKAVLQENGGPIDVDKLEKFLVEKDKDKASLLPKEESTEFKEFETVGIYSEGKIHQPSFYPRKVLYFLNDFDLPIYGALLDVLVSSVSDVKNANLIRWRQLLNVIRLIQNNADTDHVMSILMPVGKGKFQNSRHFKMMYSTRSRPTHEPHSMCKISAAHQNREKNTQREFDLSTRIENQRNKREFHGPGWARPETRKPVISIGLQNPLEKTELPARNTQTGSIRNSSLVPKTKSLSCENAHSFNGVTNPASVDDVKEDKQEEVELRETNFGIQAMAL